ncbi:DUF916 domain-containing protein [Lactobacillus sp. S2-2]|uniref:WxL protein peptidoglycan domain-containing protein n=1 Tax=Lactobacillus sp. S2-2 TaxID=2692917 RepID=UPI001F45ADE7|nr:DUF916 domain-containing protein [Lactobacillus sp. S2-2]
MNTILTNQKNKKVSYFDINSNKNHIRKLKLRVTNKSKKSKKIIIKINNSTTTDNVMANYSNLGNNENNKNELNKYTYENERYQEITLKRKESRLITLRIKPQKHLVGDILGGIDISEKPNNQNNNKNFQNIIHYTTAIYIHGKRYDSNPNIDFNQTTYKNKNLALNIVNKAPILINHLSINYILKDKDGHNVSQNYQEDKQITPNGNFNYSIYKDEHKLKNGTYYLNLTMSSGKNKWETNKKIEIINNKIITTNIHPINQNILLAIILIAFILLTIIISLIIKNKKKAVSK